MSENENSQQITHVLNRDKKYLSEHGQKLFNAINCFLDDNEQLELTQALLKYQREHNVFTLVRSCCELFDTSRKKSLMLFMRPVIPIKDRFHYDEYYKLFFPEEFSTDVKSIFCELIPKDLLEKTLKKANEKKLLNLEKEKEKEQQECLATIKLLEKANYDLNLDIQKLMQNPDDNQEKEADKVENKSQINFPGNYNNNNYDYETNTVKIAGFRIISISPKEDESIGFDVCLGPTGTFIMISYVEPNSVVEQLGMKIGDELVSVNDISFKMMDLEQAIEILSTEASMKIVLQTSGFMPETNENELDINEKNGIIFANDWVYPFGLKTNAPSETKSTLKRLIRRITISPKLIKSLGIRIRGGIEYSLGIFISFIEPQSDAYMAGLRISDQIIEVNGQTFSRITHTNAINIFRTSMINYLLHRTPIKLTVRYLGKLPVLVKRENGPVRELVKLDHEHDSAIFLEDSVKISKNCLNEKEISYAESLRECFDSLHEYNMFKYFLSDYVGTRINIQYFLFLVTNRILKSFEKLIKNKNFENLIRTEDKELFNNYLEKMEFINKKESINLNDDYKKHLITRSAEFLNEVTDSSTINCIKNKGLEKKSFYKSLGDLLTLS